MRKCAAWLKAVDIIMGIMGAGFFTGFALYARAYDTHVSYLITAALPFHIVIVLCCYAELAVFWGIASHIGRDNSFSLENKKAFRLMAVIALGIAASFFGMLAFFALRRELIVIRTLYLCCMGTISLLFATLCEVLSRLIYHAYLVKHENDLTI